jgi:hypothetical protein
MRVRFSMRLPDLTRPLLLVAIFPGFLAVKAAATTYYVDVNSPNPTPPYASWATASTNIQNAINATANGDEVLVNDGIYYGGIVATDAITIQSVDGSGATWIDGNHTAGCANLADGCALTGFTLTNGYAFNGGGVYCGGSDFISGCLITSNTSWANFAGGVFGGMVSNCMVLNNDTSNSGANGGGVAYSTVINCTVAGNVSTFGGGAYLCTLTNCVVRNNVAMGGGGAYSCTLYNCAVSNNVAMLMPAASGGTQILGGGLCFCAANNCNVSFNHVVNQYGDTRVTEGGGASFGTLNNCLLFMNTANQYFGGGGATYEGTLNNCTVVDNSSYVTAGGTYDSTVNNSIIRFNGVNYSGGSLNYCTTIPLPPGPGNFTNDPAFVNNAGNFNLQSNSPCINAGNNAYATNSTDLNGNPRIVGGTIDIGAYEYQTPVSMTSYQWLEQYGLPITTNTDASDPNGTPYNVYQDWIAGLNPTNPASVLVMLPPQPTNNASGITVSWESVSGINYNLLRATSIPAPSGFLTIQSNIVGQAGTTSYTDTTTTNGGPYFYEVAVP